MNEAIKQQLITALNSLLVALKKSIADENSKLTGKRSSMPDAQTINMAWIDVVHAVLADLIQFKIELLDTPNTLEMYSYNELAASSVH